MSFDVMWIGQGGFIFRLGDKSLCIDPYFSNSVQKVDSFQRLVPPPMKPGDLDVTMVLCTHDHLDHLDEETLRRTDWTSTRFAGPSSCLDHYRRMGIPEENLTSFNRGETLRLGSAVLHAVFADHTDDSVGVVIDYEGVAVYVMGDSRDHKRLRDVRRHRPDIVFACINGQLGNMDYRQAAALAEDLGVQVAVPCHYGMFKENTEDPNKFRSALASADVAYVHLPYAEWRPLASLLAGGGSR